MAWSQFFGKVTGRSSTAGTRVGTKDSGLSMLAASKTGAITVELRHWQGKDYFELRFIEWGDSKFEDIPLLTGHFVQGEGAPVLHLHEPTVRAHVEREALKALTKED
jgi:hypothetical protein